MCRRTQLSCRGHSSRVEGHSSRVREHSSRVRRHSSGCNSLSGLQVGEGMIQNFSVRRIKASFSEVGQFPFGIASWAKRRSKRFCAEDQGFLSEAVQFPFGFASWRKGDPNVSVRRIEASFRKWGNSLSGNLRSAPECTRKCTRMCTGSAKECTGEVHQKVHQE